MIIKNNIISIFKEVLLIMCFITVVVIVALSCGLVLIVLDSVRQDNENNKYNNQILMEKWKEIENYRKLKKTKRG